ncbi:polysaccharide lyase 8 family protein [Microlunatus speluncae]|uniref:polysaccharide lyase 8 family protein n=1 Tax=Microlunatus speluncae TaxID=2594267 RepID=UPI0012665D6E|nr:polysaccharide lyase 8 family protein [Microlunatus speluncae]
MTSPAGESADHNSDRSGWPRRRLLAVAGASLVGAGLLRNAAPAAAATGFQALRERAAGLYLGRSFDAATEPFKTALASMITKASGFAASYAPATGKLWPDLDYADPDPNTDPDSFGYSSRLTGSYARLVTMAEAYVRPGTSLTGDAALLDKIIDGLEQLDAEVYGAGRKRFGNWWDFQIGTPQKLATIAGLIFDRLSAEQRARYAAAIEHFVPDDAVADYTGTSTGANRVDLCRGIIGGAMISENADRLALGRDALSPVFPYVTAGDGYYADGSFVQHTWVPYIGGYGAVLIDGLGWAFALLAGSEWEITDPGRELFLATIELATAPFIYNGLMMDNVSGRGISRNSSSEFRRGTPVLGAIAVIAQGATAEQRTRWESMIKGWLARNDHDNPLIDPGQSLVRLGNLKAIMDDAAVEPAAEPVEHRVFGSQDRVSHRRPGWAAAVSMASKRIAYYEVGNGENLHGWQTGSGWLQWWTDATTAQYSDAYWPTVDPYRLPGITASLKPLADGAGGEWGKARPDTNWSGGCTDGEFGAAGQDLQGPLSTLRAKKSWFSLDHGILCLGAGITATDGFEIDTVVDNRLVGDQPRQTLVDGVALPGEAAGEAHFARARWVHLEGHAGYVFPSGTRITVLDEHRTGSWREINKGGPETPITRRYLTVFLDHGVDPTDARYAYWLLPGASAADTAKLAGPESRGRYQITANSAVVQAVDVDHLGLTAANFWAAAGAGSITASGPASVLIRRAADGTALVCVSDPTRGAGPLTITWDRPVAEVISKPATVSAISTGERLSITFSGLADAAGGTQSVRVQLG